MKRADGRYQAAVYVLTTTGERKRKFVYGKTWDEVNDKRVEMLENNRKGVPSISSNMKLGDFLDYWLEEIIKVNRGPSTYAGYEIVVRRYIKKHLATKRLNALTPAHVRAFVAQLRREKTVLGKPLSDRYVQNVFETLRSALSTAVREELIGRNVARLVETPSRGSFEIEPLSEVQAKAFVRAAAEHWLYALSLILITSGLRKGEVLGLAWSDIDPATGAFRVRRTVQRVRGRLEFGKTKTKKSTRSLYLGRVCLAALARQREETAKRLRSPLNPAPGQPDDLIFVTSSGRVVEPRNVNTMLQRLLRRAGLDPARVHDLRHTAATLLLMDGATIREVMEQLGHASIATTANIYGHVLDEAKQRMAARMDRLADDD
ncbi:tyrosine-type recombinase/integrase [Amycolatopsis kentuckyensis]|uniref:tyrosine-type recombinase/integrase n=1 Tax=Amycolatopsis kentuckyensis TaxID=218823 RepID=UPI001302AB47|nr:tyrosine-type recombinase/integrase [Amycolatopsis kentuckyensis]